jgi:methylated-DNA-[protein]-cysteine S-methyltransferase
MLYTTFHSPLGELLLVGDGHSLQRLSMQSGLRPAAINSDWQQSDRHFTTVREQLEEYFDGVRRGFEIQLALRGSTFELRVWEELRRIPYGQTTTYGELARALGLPDAARAVGVANARNPVAVIVPCHRVIGAGGALTGYGGGLDRKRLLLELEAGVLPLLAA